MQNHFFTVKLQGMACVGTSLEANNVIGILT